MADSERWHVYVLPANLVAGSLWTGSFAEYPDVDYHEGMMTLQSEVEDEPAVYVSMASAAGVFVARDSQLAYQPKPPQAAETLTVDQVREDGT